MPTRSASSRNIESAGWPGAEVRGRTVVGDCPGVADGRDAKSDDATPRNRDRAAPFAAGLILQVSLSLGATIARSSPSLSLSLLLFQSAEMSGAARIPTQQQPAACPKRGFLSVRSSRLRTRVRRQRRSTRRMCSNVLGIKTSDGNHPWDRVARRRLINVIK